MSIVTESALRERLRRPRVGARVDLPRGATLSPAARDFVAQWQLELVEGGGGGGGDDGGGDAPSREIDRTSPRPTWDRPSTFPVVTSGDAPRCVTCGGEVTEKPDHVTQLDACHVAPKNLPRIRLRGRIDSLQALTLVVASRAAATTNPQLAQHLGTVAAYCRELLAAEYAERPTVPPTIAGQDADEVHRATHDPDAVLGTGHLAPGPGDPEVLLWCNHLRAQVREVELVAIDAFPSPHHAYGASIVHGLNRLSSVVYYLELRLAAEGGTW